MSELRTEIALLLKSLSADEIGVRSERVVDRLSIWLDRNRPETSVVAVYRPMEPNRLGEANPSSIALRSEFQTLHFAFPRVIDRFHGRMDFAIPMSTTDWARGPYGNLEPLPDLPAVGVHEIGVVVVPGVVFGRQGERIGRGAGFYDRFLARARGAIRVGFAFDIQLQEGRVPQSEWDVQMDVVVTESEVIVTGSRPLP